MKPRPNYMPPEQFNQVIEAIPQLKIRKWKDYDVQMLFKCSYWLALRIDETYNLEKKNFDFEINQVWLGHTKTEKTATATIPKPFINELREFVESKEDGKIFEGMNYQTTIFWIKRLGKMLNIIAWTTPQSETGEKTKTHIFRKSIGKDLIYGTRGKKATLPFVSQTLRHSGHNQLAMTMKYLKVGAEDLSDFWEDLDKQNNIV